MSSTRDLGALGLLRSAGPQDLEALVELARSTFRAAFAPMCSAAAMEKHLAATFSSEQLASELSDPAVHTLLAGAEGAWTAYATLRVHQDFDPSVRRPRSATSATAATDDDVWQLQRIYLRASAQGSGVADALLAESLRRCGRHQARSLWLAVWEHNHRALSFYRRWGFCQVGDQPYMLGDEEQRDLVLARDMSGVQLRPLAPGDHAAVHAGLIEVYRAFDAVGAGYGTGEADMQNLPSWYRKPGWSYLVAEQAGALLGGGGLAPLGAAQLATCELRKLWLHAHARGLGVGRSLVEAIMERARQLGYRRMYLETVPRMEAANQLYQRLGFERLQEPLAGGGHCKCDHYYLRTLT